MQDQSLPAESRDSAKRAGSEAIPGGFANQHKSSPPEDAQSHNALEVVPTLDAIRAAEKLATGAVDLLRVYRRERDPKPAALIDDARTRLRLALEQLAPEGSQP